MKLKDNETKYRRVVGDLGNKPSDVYDILKAFNVTCPATQHAVKKLLCPGMRGDKNYLRDLREAGQSVARAVQLAERDPENAVPDTQVRDV